MKRIQKLHLRNFKAFRDQEFDFTGGPHDPDGRNVLVYGNNGSGKSSVFWALYTFLQSVGKTPPTDIAKYFVPLRDGAPETYESLRYVFAGPDEEASIKLTWADLPGAATVTTQQLGLDKAGADPLNEQQPLSVAQRTRTGPASGTDTTIREALLSSDFIHYRFLQDFYQRSNREGVNLWPVFMRDLFPFYQTPLFSTPAGNPQYLEEVLRIVLETAHSRRRWEKKPKEEFEADYITRANEAIGLFVNSVQTNANAFLRDQFLGGDESLQIELNFTKQLTFDLLRFAPLSAIQREWRNNIEDLAIILSVRALRPGHSEVRHYRPQSFLNEAQLTRIALAVRLGALLTRPANSTLKLLCLDDLLISLDMGNRKHVLDWLFGDNGKYCQEYQIFFFTHDRELYRMLKHYIGRPHSGKWRVLELVNNEQFPKPQPSLLDGDSNDHFTQAWRRFQAEDFPACANYLRKETERLLKEILPPADLYMYPNEKGETIPMPMGTQLDKLQQLFIKLGKGDNMGKLHDLQLFKQILLNPLSHDSFSTTVYQSELHTMLVDTIPELQKMRRSVVAELPSTGQKLIYLTETDSENTRYTYTIELYETLWAYTFPDGSVAYSHPACQVLERIDDKGKKTVFNKKQGTCEGLADGYRRICFALGKKPEGGGQPIPLLPKPLHTIITTTI
ncbi:ATP-binding protein [Hymenobacter chitinivorans]|uniref:AAA domain-containing protein n=1 Tax=Hymenobacter chitinivorans DSM 11115 TaxID=1121954 RepID=A0A2M9B9I3_9BACT|nr:ATP-binding protein [Hymenobacter chitinivorans]PJJ54612.1 AAA domain-containing protein [Hymenobacter chitinivorans DSM 11115]